MTNQHSVNVISVRKAREHLATMLNRFRAGQPEPIIFGEGKPEAVVIPFEDYRRLLRYEAAAEAQEDAFLGTVRDRVTTQTSEPAGDLADFAKTLGDAGAAWSKGRRQDGDRL